MPPQRPSITSLHPDALATLLEGTGRAQQVWELIRAGKDPLQPGLLAVGARARLQSAARTSTTEITQRQVSHDGTRKLLTAHTPHTTPIEVVVLPELTAASTDASSSTTGQSSGKPAAASKRRQRRSTVCVSTQVGCARACAFCVTGTMGLRRSLDVEEIVGQVLCAMKEVEEAALPPLRNVVLMGMGEPLDNLEATRRAIDIITAPHGLRIAPRHVTLSTVGTSPKAIRSLSDVPARLAWSLHSADEALRRRLIPTTRHSLSDLRQAFLEIARDHGKHLFVEITLLRGVNDSLQQAAAVADFLEPFLPELRINLLPMNGQGQDNTPWAATSAEQAEAFRQVLQQRGYFCAVRRARGADIAAACGQLVRDGVA